MDSGRSQPSHVENVFANYEARRSAIIRALTTDFDEFYQRCDPAKELCLCAHPNGEWEVRSPVDQIPAELPEPTLGINFARDGMIESDWLALVSVHSDAWLMAVAFYFGARFGFNSADRKCLFGMINDMPTIYEVVSGKYSERNGSSKHSSNKSMSNSKVGASEVHVKKLKLEMIQPKEEEDEGGYGENEEKQEETLCGSCREVYRLGEFWIFCDICEKWFHGECVKITPARADRIKQYKCPSCNSKRGMHPT